MAALSIGHLCHCKHRSLELLRTRKDSRTFTTVSCQNHDQKTRKETKEPKEVLTLQKFMVGVEKLGKGLQENMSPKRKGDWKDITLMSLSFALYVYMSQKIVCAYCAWMSTPTHPW